MCKCTPNIRTPYCGKLGCEWPGSKPEGARLSDPNEKQKCADCGHPAHRQACTAHVGFDGDWCSCVGSSCAPRADGSAAEVKRYFVHNRIDREHGYEMPCSVEMVDASAFDAVVAELDEARDAFVRQSGRLEQAERQFASRVAELEQRIAELQPAADCWNALCACDRITCMGWAELGRPDEAGRWPLPKEPGFAHATFNLWTGSPARLVAKDEQDKLGREVLSHFISKAVLNNKAALRPSGEGEKNTSAHIQD